MRWLDCVDADGDLFPVGAVADCQAGDGPGAANAQMDDAPGEFRCGDAGCVGGSDVCECGDLEMFSGTETFEAAWNFFAHIIDGYLS